MLQEFTHKPVTVLVTGAYMDLAHPQMFLNLLECLLSRIDGCVFNAPESAIYNLPTAGDFTIICTCYLFLINLL